jgi:hypothetical protein
MTRQAGYAARQALAGLVAFACAAATTGAALAHGDHGTGRPGPDLLDCEHLPTDAVTTLPAPLGDWARVECSPSGQMLAPGSQWSWRYPATYVVRPQAPAWSPAASVGTPGAKYFIDFRLAPLDAAARDAEHVRLLRDSPTYKFWFDAPASEAWRLIAENNLGHEFEIVFPKDRKGRWWAILCVPDCRPEYAFLMEPVESVR